MCNKSISNTSTSKFISDILYLRGVDCAVISPGSRNTPLTKAFIENKKIKCYSQIDERSAAYFALGIARTNNKPTAIITTSGTAVANLMPAVIEASLSKIPLLLLTADRPKELIHTGASQTIDQVNLFGSYVRKMIDFDLQDNQILEKFEKIHQFLDYALGNKTLLPPGPLHFNFRFDEPLLDKDISRPKIIKHKIYKRKFDKVLLGEFKNPLIICGPLDKKTSEKALISLSEEIGAPILADSLSQLRFNTISEKINVYYDSYIQSLKTKPDIILRFGDKPISKNLNLFIDKYKSITYLIDEFAGFNDDAQNLIISDINNFKKAVIKEDESRNLQNEIINHEERINKLFMENIENSNSQAEVLQRALKHIKTNDRIFIGSSTIIRTFDQFSGKCRKSINLFSNHITRGIDGTVSSALGMAATEKKGNNFLFIGDVSFFYDLNAFHILRSDIINLNIIVINNNGGQIFSRLPYSNDNIKNFNKYWITPLETTVEKASKLFNLNYLKTKIDNIENILKKIIIKKGINVIEVSVDNEKDVSFISKITRQ